MMSKVLAITTTQERADHLAQSIDCTFFSGDCNTCVFQSRAYYYLQSERELLPETENAIDNFIDGYLGCLNQYTNNI